MFVMTFTRIAGMLLLISAVLVWKNVSTISVGYCIPVRAITYIAPHSCILEYLLPTFIKDFLPLIYMNIPLCKLQVVRFIRYS